MIGAYLVQKNMYNLRRSPPNILAVKRVQLYQAGANLHRQFAAGPPYEWAIEASSQLGRMRLNPLSCLKKVHMEFPCISFSLITGPTRSL